MEPGVVLAIAAAAFVAVLWALRRSSKGDGRLTGLIYMPGALAMIWAGTRVASGNLGLGAVMVFTGAITLVLLIRALRVDSSSPISATHASGMAEQWVSYLIWTAIGVPIVFAIVLLAFAIAERYNSP